MAKRRRAKSWPRIWQRGASWRVDCGKVFGPRIQKQFPTREEAEKYATDMRAEREALKETERFERRNRSVSLTNLTDTQRADVVKAYDLLAGKGSLLSAVEFYLRHAAPETGAKSMQEVLAEYLTVKEQANRRPRTLTDARLKLAGIVGEHERSGVHAITTEDLERWLNGRKLQNGSRAAYIRAFLGFFNHAVKRRYRADNPAAALERPTLDETMPHIHTVAEVRAILSAAQSVAPAMLPYLVIGYFAGLRPENELAGLDWRDIDFDSRIIRVRPETAKKRRARFVKMSENLVLWLMPHRQPEGRLFFSRRYFRAIREAAKVEWVKDVMRHSFASYHVAQHQDAAQTSLELGHAGKADVLFQHYRNLVKAKDAAAYWNLAPVEPQAAVELTPPAAATVVA